MKQEKREILGCLRKLPRGGSVWIGFEYRASQVALVVKKPPTNAGDIKSHRFNPWVWKVPWRRTWQPMPVFLPGESHGQRNLVGYSPWDCRVGYDWSDLAHVHALRYWVGIHLVDLVMWWAGELVEGAFQAERTMELGRALMKMVEGGIPGREDDGARESIDENVREGSSGAGLC